MLPIWYEILLNTSAFWWKQECKKLQTHSNQEDKLLNLKYIENVPSAIDQTLQDLVKFDKVLHSNLT